MYIYIYTLKWKWHEAKYGNPYSKCVLCIYTEDSYMFSRKQIKFNLPWFLNKKIIHAPALNAWFFLLENQWAFESSVKVVNESFSCTLFFFFFFLRKDGSQNHSHCWKGFKYTKMLENQRICGTWIIFLKNSRPFNCSGQTRDSWTTITKQKKTAVDHSGNNTLLRIKRM